MGLGRAGVDAADVGDDPGGLCDRAAAMNEPHRPSPVWSGNFVRIYPAGKLRLIYRRSAGLYGAGLISCPVFL